MSAIVNSGEFFTVIHDAYETYNGGLGDPSNQATPAAATATILSAFTRDTASKFLTGLIHDLGPVSGVAQVGSSSTRPWGERSRVATAGTQRHPYRARP